MTAPSNLLRQKNYLKILPLKRTQQQIALYSAATGMLLVGAGCAKFTSTGVSPSTLKAAAPVNMPGLTVAHASAPAPRATEPPNSLSIPTWAQGAVIHKVPVRPGEKVFALTFDDGPWPEYTREVLRILAANNIKATFFMVGHEVRARPDVARAVRDAGHAIGNHSWDHPSRPRDPVGQVERTDQAIEKALGFRPTIFRPPYGLLKNGMARQAEQEKDAVLIWSADCADWKKPGAGSIASMIISQASPGGIALMHDGGGDRHQTVEALPRIINTLRERGYRFVTIPELLRMRYINPYAPKAAGLHTSLGKSSQGKTKHSKKRHKKH
ncbi:MAG: polysaccharide deacetylase family protein [Abitibacteriaceae bacterium]|nr:polysaccharide deacetylase family protein [Abditibacteriaceae bacterium]MBV9867903.1 polysaccharide deacetylase family protein [Abditibacteriaceae bacterium]